MDAGTQTHRRLGNSGGGYTGEGFFLVREGMERIIEVEVEGVAMGGGGVMAVVVGMGVGNLFGCLTNF